MYSNPRCYASRLGTCSHDVDREHYISHGVLKEIGKTLTVLINGAPQTFNVKDFAFEVLCKTHNNALSPVDEVAKVVFKTIVKLDYEAAHGNKKVPHRAVRASGWDFERWLIKVYCGINAAGHLGKTWPVADYLLEALFNRTPLPLDLGLYMGGNVGDLVTIGKTLQLRPLSRPDTGEPCGLLVDFCGIGFRLSLAPARDGGTGKVDGRDRHVPGITLRDERSGLVRELEFDWS
jgi:hypothetical protein